MITKYIESNVKTNVKKDYDPKEIDVVFSSGGFNGTIGFGIGLYLKEMEKQRHIKVKRLSGSSIGSLISLWYIMGNLYDTFDFFEKELIEILNHFKKNKNLSLYNSFVRKYVYNVFKSDDMTPIQKRLFITYHDMKKYKKRTVCKYKNREHLIECIIRSSYIPFFTDGKDKYQNRYIDGFRPYFFTKDICNNTKDNCKNRKKREILYVNMMCKPLIYGSMIMDKNDIYKRLFIGINDANQFFINGQSSLCIYLKDMEYNIQIENTVVDFIFLTILFIIDMIITIHLDISLLISDTIIYNVSYNFFYSLFEGFFNGLLFS
jgi:hypothetical protein